MMEKKANIKGVGLVELMICMMLISLIVIAVLPVMTYGFLQLHESGSKTKALYSVQHTVEDELTTIPSSNTDTVTITFGSTIINIDGTIIEEEEPFGTKSRTSKIKVFIPYK